MRKSYQARLFFPGTEDESDVALEEQLLGIVKDHDGHFLAESFYAHADLQRLDCLVVAAEIKAQRGFDKKPRTYPEFIPALAQATAAVNLHRINKALGIVVVADGPVLAGRVLDV